MKAKPKTVWVVFKDENTPMGAETVNPGKDWYPGCEHVRYHLHPGNEAKLKRENAMMKRAIKGLWVEHCTPNVCLRGSQWSEIHAKMPGLFAGGKKGK